MSLTPWLPTVRKIRDGEQVEQAVVNVPIEQLTQRDQHLYEKFQELLNKSVLVSYGNPIHSEEILNVGELNLVFFKKAENSSQKEGLARAATGFTSSSYSSMFSPKDSNFVFGITKQIYSDGENFTADVFIEGLCEFDVDLDDSTYGLIQKNAGEVEPFAVGPYYLSSKNPGKITRDPAGIPIYIGYAISKRKLLLHTSVDEFSQFFINYRFHVLDRVAGKPQLSNGNWTIVDSDVTKLGWVSVAALDIDVPEGALFYYNIPNSTELLAEAQNNYLDEVEAEEATELAKFLPPVPNNFIQLYINGTLVRYKDEFDSIGNYSVNTYGLWWHRNSDGAQPWSSSYPSDKSPNLWKTEIKNTLSASRKNIFTSFSQFNPALRTQLVSSLKGFNTSTDKSYKFLKLYSKDNITQESSTGDLLFSVDAPVYYYGFKYPFTEADTTDVTDNLTYPTGRSSNYSTGRALAGIKYSKSEGAFQTVLTPVVAKLTGSGGIGVNDQGNGIWNITYLNQGLSGFIDSIEPINARLEFRGLNSYIKLPPESSTPYGFIGKIVIPSNYPVGRDIRLVFHLFGDIGANTSVIAFDFKYSVIPTYRETFNSVAQANLSLSNTYEASKLSFSLDTATYTAFTSKRIAVEGLKINSSHIYADSIISFQINRVAALTNNYLGNIGMLATYWEII